MSTHYKELDQVLKALGRRETVRRLLEGFLTVLIIASTLAGLLFAADTLLRLSGATRLTLLSISALAVVLAVLVAVCKGFRQPSPSWLAVQIERRSGLPFANALVTAVELYGSNQAARLGFSARLVAQCREEALQLASETQIARLSDFCRVRSLGWVFLILLGLWGAVCWAKGELVRDVLVYRYAYLFRPNADIPVAFEVSPGDRTVLEGEPIEVRVGIKGRLLSSDEPPVLRKWEEPKGTQQNITLIPAGPSTYAALFPNVTRAFRYRIDAGPFESTTHRIRVVSPPRLVKVWLQYRYPPHTGLKGQEQDRPPYDLAGPMGTTVAVRLAADKPLARARLHLPDRTVSLAASPGTTFWTGNLTLKASGSYWMELTDKEGFANPSPERFQVLSVEDKPPRVLILEPGKDLSVKPQELTTLPLKVDVSDDYGIREVKLRIKLIQKIEYNYMTTDDSLTLLPEKTAAASQTAGLQRRSIDTVWDLTKRVLQPGDTISYYAEASDNCPPSLVTTATSLTPGSHVGVSKTFTIRIPYPTELFSKVAEEEENQIASIEDLAGRQKALEDKVEKVLKDARATREIGYKERKELEQVVARQKEIKEKAQDISLRMKDSLSTLRKTDLVDESTLRKMSEIQQLFGELADSKLKENMERFREMMQGVRIDPEQMSKMMQQFDKSKYSQELERVLKGLKRIKQQQEMDRAVKKMDELVNRQEEYRSQTAGRIQKKAPTSDIAKGQEELGRDVERLVKDMGKLAESTAQEFPQTAQAIDQARREAQQSGMSNDLKEASSSLGTNQGPKAYQEMSRALSKMESLRKSLKEAQSGMQQKQMEVNLQSLVSMLSHGIRISDKQEEIQSESAFGTNVPDMRRFCLRLAGRQYAIVRGTYRLEKDFDQTFTDEILFKNMFLSQIGQLLEDMEEAKKSFEEARLFSAKQLSERSLTRLNVILVKLLEILNQMQEQQGAQSMQSFFDQMERMAEQQRRLNDKSQRLKPNESMSPFMMQMMQQMALEQEMIRQSLEQISAKYDRAKSLLGNLDELAKDMKDVEEALKKFDRSAQTRDKQEHILNRMLDYSKSIRKQGQSETRQAEQARDFTPKLLTPPLSRDLTEVRQKLHENLSRESYPPQYRKNVEDYFSSFGP